MQDIPFNPDEATFIAFAKKCTATVFPLVFKASNDGIFAWAAFHQLEKENDYAFLLESAETGINGRYSYMGFSPRRLITVLNGVFSVSDGDGNTLKKSECKDPIAALENFIKPLQTPPFAFKKLPPFWGGLVGYLGYDCAHYFENIGDMKTDLLQVPDMLWMQTDIVLIFDHHRHDLYLLKNCHVEDAIGDWGNFYRLARTVFDEMLTKMAVPSPCLKLPDKEPDMPEIAPQQNMSREDYYEKVEACKRHIRAGDVFQVVPSLRFSFSQPAPSLALYRCLRRINPSPYMFYFKCGNFVVAGSSPELMASCMGEEVKVRPIAGTRPRGSDANEDKRLEDELRGDEKELAEHLMLVDLGRNDIGRVAKPGSVRVPKEKFCSIERYSHVMHMVSHVEGEKEEELSSFDVTRATFPAGTLSGAPKVRAMQIINDLEPCKRNLYGGFAGFFNYNGDMATCIVIRTLVIKDGVCHVQAGAGIVADSQPQKEYEEAVNKAAAVLKAAQLAAAGL